MQLVQSVLWGMTVYALFPGHVATDPGVDHTRLSHNSVGAATDVDTGGNPLAVEASLSHPADHTGARLPVQSEELLPSWTVSADVAETMRSSRLGQGLNLTF